ncbi:VOC family protein [Profundibacter sp.]|uniref:VOC family protein n=1 Tax=Profundibacter sp. TaxID=3101071 RepID=UPI003D0A94A1
MKLSGLDHLVLTVADIDATVRFYCDVLGMEAQRFTPVDGTTRWALKFGVQKINLHQVGREFEPKAKRATAGSADLCFLSDMPVADWQAHLTDHGVEVIEGPVKRTGAQGPIRSVYLHDPDGNLIEVSNRL